MGWRRCSFELELEVDEMVAGEEIEMWSAKSLEDLMFDLGTGWAQRQ